MGRLQGKVAVVTGSGRGVGQAIAMAMAAEGASIGVLSLTPSKVEETVKDIVAAGGTAVGIVCDVRDVDQIKSSVAKVLEAFGKIDVLVNNAMGKDFDLKPLMAVQAEDVEALMNMGPIASLRFMQAVRPHMQTGGRVINFGTGLAVSGAPGTLPLSMAKESIRALTRVAAREWGADGITVNTICPLAMTDGMQAMGQKFAALGRSAPPPPPPIGRLGTPEDVAPLAVFLASDEGGYLTGYTFFADGGLAMDAAR